MNAVSAARRLTTRPIHGFGPLDLAAAAVLSVYAVLLVGKGQAHSGVGPAIAALTMTLPVAWRRPRPVAAAAVLAAGAALNAAAFAHIVRCGVALPAVFLVGYAAGAYLADRRRAGVGVALCAVNVTLQCVSDPRLGAAQAFVMVPILLAFFGVGRLVRAHGLASEALRTRSAELREQRDRTARLAVLADRAELGAGLDERLGSGIDRIASAAASGRAALGTDPAAGSLALKSIEQEGRAVLQQMRDMVGTLHEAPADARPYPALPHPAQANPAQMTAVAPPPPPPPQPTLADLSGLLQRATTSEARLTIEGGARTLSAGLELSAYRIVEHLLVALRDRPETAIDVRLRFEPEYLELTMSGPPAGSVDLRAVLAAARERASLHGGMVDARPAGDAHESGAGSGSGSETELLELLARLPLVSA